MIDFDDREDAELERLARDLGAAAGERLDLERTVQGVLGRLREARVAERPWWAQPRVLRIAAGLALFIGGGLTVRGLLRTSAGPAAVAVVQAAGGVDDLSADQLTELLPALDSTGDTVAPADDVGIEGLNADDLRQLLAVMKGEG